MSVVMAESVPDLGELGPSEHAFPLLGLSN